MPTVLTEPTAIPTTVANIIDEPGAFLFAADPGPYSRDAVPVIGGIPGASPTVAPPPKPPAPPAPKAAPPPPSAPVRVGGEVRPPVLIHRVDPVYPPLARQARIAGVVQITAILARNGTVRALSITNGHPFLAKAALDAVSQWRYEPTLLNGHPTEIELVIDVTFNLR
jgi:protein TonB